MIRSKRYVNIANIKAGLGKAGLGSDSDLMSVLYLRSQKEKPKRT